MRARDSDSWLTILPPLSPAAYLQPPRRELPFPLDQPSYRLFAMARRALWHGVKSLGIEHGAEVLVPGLHHGSEVEALIRAGFTPRFYDVDEGMAPREHELEACLGPRTRALYLIHALGIPQDPPRWRRWCDERGLLLIEDAAMALLSTWEGRPIGSFGDLAIFCLYKTVPVPDGGAVVGGASTARPTGRPRTGAARLLRRHAAWAAQRTPPIARAQSRTYDPVYRPSKERIVLGDLEAPAAVTTAYLLPRVADPAVAAQRRANYVRLLDALRDQVAPPFHDLPEGASPFAFPLDSDDVLGRARRFADRGVHATRLWPIGHPSSPPVDTPVAQRLRDRVVTLPVHQGLREIDLERIVEAGRAR